MATLYSCSQFASQQTSEGILGKCDSDTVLHSTQACMCQLYNQTPRLLLSDTCVKFFSPRAKGDQDTTDFLIKLSAIRTLSLATTIQEQPLMSHLSIPPFHTRRKEDLKICASVERSPVASNRGFHSCSGVDPYQE